MTRKQALLRGKNGEEESGDDCDDEEKAGRNPEQSEFVFHRVKVLLLLVMD